MAVPVSESQPQALPSGVQDAPVFAAHANTRVSENHEEQKPAITGAADSSSLVSSMVAGVVPLLQPSPPQPQKPESAAPSPSPALHSTSLSPASLALPPSQAMHSPLLSETNSPSLPASPAGMPESEANVDLSPGRQNATAPGDEISPASGIADRLPVTAVAEASGAALQADSGFAVTSTRPAEQLPMPESAPSSVTGSLPSPQARVADASAHIDPRPSLASSDRSPETPAIDSPVAPAPTARAWTEKPMPQELGPAPVSQVPIPTSSAESAQGTTTPAAILPNARNAASSLRASAQAAVKLVNPGAVSRATSEPVPALQVAIPATADSSTPQPISDAPAQTEPSNLVGEPSRQPGTIVRAIEIPAHNPTPAQTTVPTAVLQALPLPNSYTAATDTLAVPASESASSVAPIAKADAPVAVTRVSTERRAGAAKSTTAAAHAPAAASDVVASGNGSLPVRNPETVGQPQLASFTTTARDAAAPREAFATLDGAPPSAASATWTHAGPQQAEAGFQDPVLGWVGVRAESAGGGIHAALVPGSNEAAQALGTHMDGLHSYLAAQHTPVESLVMAAPARGAQPEAGAFMNGAGQQMQQGSGHTAQQRSQSAQHPVLSAMEPETPIAPQAVSAAGVEFTPDARGGRFSAVA